jgi:hypothetical protein
VGAEKKIGADSPVSGAFLKAPEMRPKFHALGYDPSLF